MNFSFSDKHKMIIGMVHCLPLPGTYRSSNDIETVVARAVEDARCLEQCGYDAIIVENEDLSLSSHMTKMQFSAMSMIVHEVRKAVSLSVGICCGCLNYEEALSIAQVCGCEFIRTPIFVDTVINYNGIINPCSTSLIEYRKQIGSEQIKVLADIQVKHYHMLCSSISISESAQWAEHQGADAVIVTGLASGVETPIENLRKAKNAVSIPVAVGSGITRENVSQQLEIADILIIGTSIRQNRSMSEPIDCTNAMAMIKAVQQWKAR